ncbi:MAG: Ig-like domain-containing protein, partial [Chloroflexota bacterium]|nr:Ig-like domain-containing protein [Chloroflexota bacterium]
FTSPVFAYSHGPPLISPTNGCAIVGGDFYNPAVTTFPSEYVGDYFFADNCSGWIRRVDPANGFAVSDFATGIAGPVDIEVGADGSLYYLSRPETGSGSVYRVSYSGAPAISQQPSDTTVAPGQAATFSVSATGQGPLAYQWQRDGVDIAGATSSTYTLADPTLSDDGAQFRCVVSNAGGSATSASATLTVTTNTAPTGTIVSPMEGTTFNAGQTISYEGTGTDAEDGELPAGVFTWEIAFHHNTHTHSFIPAFSGVKSGTFDIPDTGETADDIFYRIHLTVTDSGGRQHSSYRDVRPNKSSMTVATSPAGLQVTVEAEPKASPYSTLSVVGMKRTLGVVSPQTVNGVTYEFSSWSDGGAATHEITTPSADTTYTATFTAVADTVKPAVAVTAPAAGASVSGNVNLAANASDAGGVTKVEWWVDGVRVATDTDGAPWTKAWNSASVADGTHKIIAKARDTAGNWGTSPSVMFSVSQTPPPPDTTAPSVTVTAPTAGATVSGSSATLSANATDNVAVTSVKWFVDGVEVAADTNGAPWTATWNSTTVADGGHTVVAKAADAAGNLGTSDSVSFTVSNAPVGGALFSDGFESGGFSAWSTVRTGADGTATVQTPAAKTGTYGAQLSATASTGSYAYARKTVATQTELTVSGDFKVTQEGVSGGDVVFFRLLDPTGARVAS